MLYNITGCIVT